MKGGSQVLGGLRLCLLLSLSPQMIWRCRVPALMGLVVLLGVCGVFLFMWLLPGSSKHLSRLSCGYLRAKVMCRNSQGRHFLAPWRTSYQSVLCSPCPVLLVNSFCFPVAASGRPTQGFKQKLFRSVMAVWWLSENLCVCSCKGVFSLKSCLAATTVIGFKLFTLFKAVS